MKKKGFTLIELLAVIVVLAVIALITVPTILSVIEKTRKNSLIDSAYGLIESANLYAAQYGMNSISRFDIENGIQTSTKKLSYKGKIENGTVLINTSGEVTVCVNSKNYSAYKNYKDSKVTLVDNKKCTWNETYNQVYLDDDKTITEYTNQELTELISKLQNEIDNLKEISEKVSSLEETHSTDVTAMNTTIIENNNNQSVINTNLQNEITILKDNSYTKTEVDSLVKNLNDKLKEMNTNILNSNNSQATTNTNLQNQIDTLNSKIVTISDKFATGTIKINSGTWTSGSFLASKVNGYININIGVVNFNKAAKTTIITIPVGFRPSTWTQIPVYTDSGIDTCVVGTDGKVYFEHQVTTNFVLFTGGWNVKGS